jgi:hypothetical protein
MKMPTVDQMTAAPTRKVMAITVAGAVFTVLVWVAREFGQVEVPGEVQGAVHTAIAAAVGYFVRDRMNS